MAKKLTKPTSDAVRRSGSSGEKQNGGRNFSLQWGAGVIAEEARIAGPYHCPAIQLLQFTEGQAAGTRQIRFCYYDHRGRFQRSPLILSEDTLEGLGRALKQSPRLRSMLKRLLG